MNLVASFSSPGGELDPHGDCASSPSLNLADPPHPCMNGLPNLDPHLLASISHASPLVSTLLEHDADTTAKPCSNHERINSSMRSPCSGEMNFLWFASQDSVNIKEGALSAMSHGGTVPARRKVFENFGGSVGWSDDGKSLLNSPSHNVHPRASNSSNELDCPEWFSSFTNWIDCLEPDPQQPLQKPSSSSRLSSDPTLHFDATGDATCFQNFPASIGFPILRATSSVSVEEEGATRLSRNSSVRMISAVDLVNLDAVSCRSEMDAKSGDLELCSPLSWTAEVSSQTLFQSPKHVALLPSPNGVLSTQHLNLHIDRNPSTHSGTPFIHPITTPSIPPSPAFSAPITPFIMSPLAVNVPKPFVAVDSPHMMSSNPAPLASKPPLKTSAWHASSIAHSTLISPISPHLTIPAPQLRDRPSTYHPTPSTGIIPAVVMKGMKRQDPGLAELAESSPSSSNPASPTPASSAFSASLPEEIQRNIHIVHAKHVVTPPPPALLLDPLAPVDAPSLLKSVLEPKIPIVEETDPPGSPDSSIIDLTPHLAKIEERKKAAAAAHAIAAIPTPRVGSTASPSPDAQTPNTPSPTTRKLSTNDAPTSASAFFETTGTIFLDPSTPSTESIHAPHEPSPTASPIPTTATLSQPVPETTDGILPVQLDPTTLLIAPTPSTATTPSLLPPAISNAQLDSILSTPVNPEFIEWTRPVTSSKPTLESAKSVASSPIASTSRERTSRVEEAADPIVLIPRRNPASRESSQDARSVHSGVSDSVSLVRELEGSPIRVGRPVLIGGGSGGTRSVQPSPVRRSQSRDVQRSLSDQMKSGEGGVAAGGLPPLPNTPSPQQQKRVPPRLVKKTISPVRTEMDAALASTEKLVLLPIARTLSFNDNDSTSPVSMDSPGSIASLAQEDHSSDSHSTTPPKLASPVVVSETPLSPNRASPPPQPCACKSLSTVSKYTLILTSTFAAAVTMETTWEHVYATRASTARFLATRGVKGFKSSGWKVSTDLEAFTVDAEGLTGDDEEDGHVAFSSVTKGMERRSEYVMPLTNPMGPKETRCYVREVVEFKDADGVITGIIQAAVMDGMKTYYKDYNAFLHETFASALPRRPHKPTTGHATPTTPHTTPSILDTKHQLSLLSQQQHDSHHHHHHPLQDEMDQLDLQAQNGRIQRVVELLTLETVARDGIAIHPSGKLPKRGSSVGDGARKGGGVGSKEFWEAVWVLWRGLTGRYWIVGVGVLVGVLVVQVGVVVGVVRVLGGRGLGEEEVRVLVGRAVEEAVKSLVVQGGVVGGERERGEL
ncbi:hypothetical protein HDU98_007941 [Podochytrium sp. JEL0797]|nr:hypothetical protein HDU98_007941 [Podochytrium sp. JEL0797]